jgi:hypothetical protein
MIEEFFRILRNLIRKREQADYEMAREGLDNLSKMITGLELKQLKTLGTEGITYFINPEKPDFAEKIFCIARMFKEDALINEAEGKPEASKESYENALEFFEMIKDKNIEEADEVKQEIELISEKLK